jgi:hypothetical protein
MPKKTPSKCSERGCDRTARVRGWCRPHYSRWWKTGSPDPHVRATVTERIWRYTDRQPGGCWLWLGAIGTTGYGAISVEEITYLVHRFVYELLVEPIPDDLHIDHLCRVRHCVNPVHLEPVTPAENAHRSNGVAAVNFYKRECKQGHPFNGKNLGIRTDGTGRYCKECKRIRTAEWQARERRR